MEVTREQSEQNRQHVMKVWYMHCVTFFARLIGIAETIINLIVLMILTLEITNHVPGCGEMCLFIGVNVKELDIYYDEDGNVTWLCDPHVDLNDNVTTTMRHERFDLFYTLCYLLTASQLAVAIALIFGTLAYNKWYAVPYFMWRTLNLAIQVYCQLNYYINIEVLTANVALSSAAVFVMTVMFTIIVFLAVRRWPDETPSDDYSEMEGGEEGRGGRSDSEPEPGPSGEVQHFWASDPDEPSTSGGLEGSVEVRRRASTLLNPGPGGASTSSASGTENVDETTPLLGSQRPRPPKFKLLARALSFFVKPRRSRDDVQLQDRSQNDSPALN